MSLAHKKLAEISARCGEKTALISDDTTVTYSDLVNNIDILSDILILEGLHKSGKVMLLMKNLTAEVTAIFATIRSGGVAIPINQTYSPAQIRNIIGIIKPWIIITTNEDLARFPFIPDIVTCPILFMENVHDSPLLTEKYRNKSLNYLNSRAIDKLTDIQPEDIALSVPYSNSANELASLNLNHHEILRIITRSHSLDSIDQEPIEPISTDLFMQFSFIRAIRILLNGGTVDISLNTVRSNDKIYSKHE
ncbi:MAG: AMP-binding protein [Ignavibacteriales bacterium]|nr:AMP-binding protein [Ignavibacteriales bacterium]